MEIRFNYSGPSGTIKIDHSKISGLTDNQVHELVSNLVIRQYAEKLENNGIEYHMTYDLDHPHSAKHIIKPSKEINEV